MFPSSRDVILHAVAFGALASPVFGRAVRARDVTPSMPAAPNTIATCTFWHDNDGSIDCADIPNFYVVPLENFLYWNPSLTASCENFQTGMSYCVEGPEAPPPPATPTPTQAPATTTTTPPATTTKPGNGVTTPTPTQPLMVDNCNKFHKVARGDACGTILRGARISLAQLFAWNPSVVGFPLEQFIKWNSGVGAQCELMWANTYVCVAVAGSQPGTPTTPKDPGNAIETPQPTQPDMVDNCNKFDFVKPGETCSGIVSRHGLSLQQFTRWNSGVGDQCQTMWANTYVCVSVAGSTTPTQPDKPSNGVQTPTPTQANMTPNCKSFHFVQPGQGCWDIANRYGISVQTFVQWNPAANSDCSGLWANTYACVAVL
ncbi:hypothetical protein MAPG_11206 [Magnaporthiopsis poae ATCC 64411]|uniref:LysM domain-containing protein n=1 Tax=Magnaporthiopsis poae (strain ATCC 64411 / 73-15) TaxID=644358 RepID=A0A0C4EEN2_MAGP6|nr:hypothetical protein MAPG_11206 [Magnaporthiopsis poae ATCC 64411]